MASKKFPFIPKDLMEHLQTMFPDKLPTNRNITVTELNYAQGERAVVDLLQRHFDNQQDNVLENR